LEMPGQVLNGRYELTEKIGEGGMAFAWKGRDLLLDRPVAVKLMRDSLAADPEFVARFRQEAQAAASLSHEHIAAVYDFGSDGGLNYIVMEYVPGEDLRRRLKRQGPLSLQEALELGIQVAEALEAAHAKGIVHRDIKPANILITPEGQVKVTDFGIARAASSSEDTSTGTLLGSVHYIAPEQARGEAVGPQADIYSLGVVLFEALAGRPPFHASNPVAVVHKHLYEPPPSLHGLRADAPMEMEGILLRCLAKELSGRYATARELLNYLRALQSRLLSAQPQVTAHEPPVTLARRRPGRAQRWPWIAGGGALAVVIGVVLMWSLSHGGSGALVSVPSLLGLDLDSARAVAEGVGLRLEKRGDLYSPAVPAGRIAIQSPPADEKLRRGSTVEVRLSLGRVTVRVPEVTEMTEAQARRQVESAGLTVGAVEEQYDESLPEGMVIASKPPAGVELSKGSTVNLVVNKKERPPEEPSGTTPGPTPPAPPPKTLSFQVPAGEAAAAEILVEASDESGRRILYRGIHAAGESIPSLKVPPARPVTIRIKMNGRVVLEKTYEE